MPGSFNWSAGDSWLKGEHKKNAKSLVKTLRKKSHTKRERSRPKSILDLFFSFFIGSNTSGTYNTEITFGLYKIMTYMNNILDRLL